MNRPRNRQPRPPRNDQRSAPGRAPRASNSNVPSTQQVVPGAAVSIVLKADQPTGREVQGVVQDLLTRGNHPRGIKVRLQDGRVGRVQGMAADASQTGATFVSSQRQKGAADGGSSEPPPRSLADFMPASESEDEALPSTTDRATFTTATAAQNAAQTAMDGEGRPHILALPAELRLQIYDYLRPCRDPYSVCYDPANAARRHAYRSLTQTCRQVHNEVSEAFYGHGHFEMVIGPQSDLDGSTIVHFLSNTMSDMQEVASSNCLLPLQRIKHLCVHVSAYAYYTPSLCSAQDTLFAVMQRFQQEHKIMSIQLEVDLYQHSDAPKVEGDRKRDELINVPFITAPLRLIRGLGTAAQPGVFTLVVEKLTALDDSLPALERDICDTICGNAPLPDLALFEPYFGILRQLMAAADQLDIKARGPAFRALCKARIDQDVGLFKNSHRAVVVKLRSPARSWSKPDKVTPAVRELRAKLLNGISELEEALEETANAVELSQRRRSGRNNGKQIATYAEAANDEEPPRKRRRGI